MTLYAGVAKPEEVNRSPNLPLIVLPVDIGDSLGIRGSTITDPDISALTDLAVYLTADGNITVRAFSGAAGADADIILVPKGAGKNTIFGGGVGTGGLKLDSQGALLHLKSSGGNATLDAGAGVVSMVGATASIATTLHTMNVDKAYEIETNLSPIFIGMGECVSTATQTIINQLPVFTFPNAATTTVRSSFRIPAWATTTNMAIRVIYSINTANGAGATAVRWSAQTALTAIGAAISSVTTTNATDTIPALEAANVTHDFAIDSAVASVAAGSIVTLRVDRVGADAADTYTGDVSFIGISITPTANQV